MSLYVITYVAGSMVVTHPTGIVDKYTVAKLTEEKARLQNDSLSNDDEIVEIDKRITNAQASLTP